MLRMFESYFRKLVANEVERQVELIKDSIEAFADKAAENALKDHAVNIVQAAESAVEDAIENNIGYAVESAVEETVESAVESAVEDALDNVDWEDKIIAVLKEASFSINI